MNISLMKIIDEYIGRVVVFIISFFKNPLKRNIPEVNCVKNILFIKFWGIGSIVLATPAMNKVKTTYPDSVITFLTLKNNSGICNEIKLVDRILTIDISNPFVLASSFTKKVLMLRKINFDIIFDFEFYTYFSAIIVALINSKSLIGFDNLRNNRKVLFSKTILFNDRIHTKDNFLNLVNADNLVNSNSLMPFNFPEFKTIKINKNGELKVMVNPNASRLAYERRLPGKNFVDIINHLRKKYKCKVLLTGSIEEISYVKNIYGQIHDKKSVENLCGKTSVKDLITLINSSVCLITNDSGPLHIASAVNTPVIAFFGPESPVRYGPLSDKKLVFYENLKCSPCMSISNSKTVNCIYNSPKCMDQFEINDVINKIDLFLSEFVIVNENPLGKC